MAVTIPRHSDQCEEQCANHYTTRGTTMNQP